jgi:hypothetical protein
VTLSNFTFFLLVSFEVACAPYLSQPGRQAHLVWQNVKLSACTKKKAEIRSIFSVQTKMRAHENKGEQQHIDDSYRKLLKIVRLVFNVTGINILDWRINERW